MTTECSRAQSTSVCQSILVARASDVDRLTEAARADLEALAVELRHALREAGIAEQAADERSRDVDTDGAGAVIQRATDELVTQRRAEHAAAIVRARARAAETIAAATTEAERIRAGDQQLRPVRLPAGAIAAGGSRSAARSTRRRADRSGLVELSRFLGTAVVLPLGAVLAVITIALVLIG